MSEKKQGYCLIYARRFLNRTKNSRKRSRLQARPKVYSDRQLCIYLSTVTRVIETVSSKRNDFKVDCNEDHMPIHNFLDSQGLRIKFDWYVEALKINDFCHIRLVPWTSLRVSRSLRLYQEIFNWRLVVHQLLRLCNAKNIYLQGYQFWMSQI